MDIDEQAKHAVSQDQTQVLEKIIPVLAILEYSTALDARAMMWCRAPVISIGDCLGMQKTIAAGNVMSS